MYKIFLSFTKILQHSEIVTSLRISIKIIIVPRSLSDVENRYENLRNGGHTSMDLRRTTALFVEKPWGYSPISQIYSRFMSKSDRLLRITAFGLAAKGRLQKS